MSNNRSPFGVIFEGTGYVLEGLAYVGAISGTAIFIFLGKALMAALFLLFMFGVVIRIRRGRLQARRAAEAQSGA